MALIRRGCFYFPLVLLLGLLAGAGSAAAGIKDGVTIEPAPGAPTPGIINEYGVYNFTVGFTAPNDVAAGFVAGAKAGHCIESTVFTGSGEGRLLTGVEGSDLSLANGDTGSLAILPGGRDRLEWLLLSSRRVQLDTPAADQRDFEAGAHQYAVWKLTNPTTTPSLAAADAALIARGDELVAASATYGPNVTRTPAIAAVGADVCAGAGRTLRVTGSPLTTVTLAITAGQGQFTSGSVAAGGQQTTLGLGATGSADVTLTGSTAGTVSVRGTFEQATLVQAEVPNTQDRGQDFAYVEIRTTTVDSSVAFLNCTTPAPTTPIVTGAGNAALRISKAAPRSARVRAAVTYTITVRNTGTSVARAVTVADAVPAGMAVVRVPARARLAKGVLRWSVGDLQPGQRVTLRVQLRATVNVARSRCNVATARAGNAPTVRARVCTRFIRVAGAARIPVVTG